MAEGTAPRRKVQEVQDCSPGCPVEAVLQLIGGKWKGVVLFHLLGGTLRFNEIRRLLPNVTQRMLTLQLREMESVGLLSRKVYAEVPPRVEYSLTPLGRSLEPVIMGLKSWGETYLVPGTAMPRCKAAAAREAHAASESLTA